eukprot:COSAG05_NODE_9611_length_612_cov_0.592593_1_plen_113_part_01
MANLTCCICAEVAADGTLCVGSGSHFTCRSCFVGYVRMRTDPDAFDMESERSDGGAAGQLRCPMAGPAGGCTARPYSDRAIARGTDDEIFQLYLDRKLRVAEQDIFERAQQQI